MSENKKTYPVEVIEKMFEDNWGIGLITEKDKNDMFEHFSKHKDRKTPLKLTADQVFSWVNSDGHSELSVKDIKFYLEQAEEELRQDGTL